MKLLTTGEGGKKIMYEFEKLDKEAPSNKIEYRTILVNKIIYEKVRSNFVFEYSFLKNENRYQNPKYIKSPTLGTDLSIATKYPKDFPLDKLSDELIISLWINIKGKVENIEIIKKLNASIDASIVEFLSKSRWEPLKMNGESVKSEVVLHLCFLLEKSSFLNR